MNPYLPGLSDGEQRREKIRRRVRPTSRAQYAVARERLNGRAANVLRWLAHHYNYTQVPPTSGELMVWTMHKGTGLPADLDCVRCAVLYVRRGLSDLQRKGLVESVPNGDRLCAYADETCCTWRVR